MRCRGHLHDAVGTRRFAEDHEVGKGAPGVGGDPVLRLGHGAQSPEAIRAPPSTSRSVPVTKLASCDTMKATALAMSWGVQARPIRFLRSRPAGSSAWPTGEPTLFGLTVFTLIP